MDIKVPVLEENLTTSLDELNGKLNSMEVFMVSHYYGIEVEKMTLSQLGGYFHLSPLMVMHIIEKAVKKLRDKN